MNKELSNLVQTISRKELESAALVVIHTRVFVDGTTDQKLREMLQSLGFWGEVLYLPPDGPIETVSRERLENLVREIVREKKQ